MEKEIWAIQPVEGVQVNWQIQSPKLCFPIGEVTDNVLERRKIPGTRRDISVLFCCLLDAKIQHGFLIKGKYNSKGENGFPWISSETSLLRIQYIIVRRMIDNCLGG